MNEGEILETVSNAKRDFGKCAKFAGAVTVEIIKQALEEAGILTSPRDVFIKGLPVEIDLLVPKKRAEPEYGLLYEPQDVLVVLEIKNYGSFGEKTINGIKENFQRIQQLNKVIYCAYLTLAERKGYKWAISEQNIGFGAYTLFWHSRSGKNFTIEPTGDWKKLLNKISKIVQNDSNANVA